MAAEIEKAISDGGTGGNLPQQPNSESPDAENNGFWKGFAVDSGADNSSCTMAKRVVESVQLKAC